MNQQIEPTLNNSKIVSDFAAIKIKQGLKERYPTAEEILDTLIKENSKIKQGG